VLFLDSHVTKTDSEEWIVNKLSLFSSSIVALLIVLAVHPVQADLFVSGDSNITSALYGLYTPVNPGNQQFFSNVLQAGSSVVLLDNSGLSDSLEKCVGDIDIYYNSLSGVSSSRFSGAVTSTQLSGADLFVAVLPDDDFSASEITVMADFLANDGSIFFLGKNSSFADRNASINGALTGLGSSLSIVNASLGGGFQAISGSQIAADPYTTGISTFTYASASEVSVAGGGTALFYDAGGTSFLAYETMVPVPGAVLLGMLGLSVAAAKLRKKKA